MIFRTIMPFYRAEDDGAGDGGVVESTQTSVEGSETAPEAGGDVDGGEPAQTPDYAAQLAEATKMSDKQAREITRLKGQLGSYQSKKAEEPADKPVERQQEPQQRQNDPVIGHPALKGETPDEDGQVYINGKWKDADDLIERYELRQQIEGVNKWREEQTTEREQRERQTAVGNIRTNVKDAVSEIRAKVFTDYPADKSGRLDARLTREVESQLEAQFAENGVDVFDPENLQKTISAVFSEYLEDMGYAGTKQFTKNAATKQTHSVRPDGGQPGVQGPKSYDKMTDAERRAKADEVAAGINRRLAS